MTEQEKQEQRELCETILKKEFSLKIAIVDTTVDMIMDLARKHIELLDKTPTA